MKGGLLPTTFGGDVDYRLTAEEKYFGEKNKVVLGTDFFGLQYKNVGVNPFETPNKNLLSSGKPSKLGMFNIDKVTRIGSDYDGNGVSSIILETTSAKKISVPFVTKLLSKFNIGLNFQVGARENISTNQVRSAVNLKFSSGLGDFAIEWRGKAYGFGDEK